MIPKIRLIAEGSKTKKKMVLAVFNETEKAERYINDLLEILGEGFSIITEELEVKEENKDVETS